MKFMEQKIANHEKRIKELEEAISSLIKKREEELDYSNSYVSPTPYHGLNWYQNQRDKKEHSSEKHTCEFKFTDEELEKIVEEVIKHR